MQQYEQLQSALDNLEELTDLEAKHLNESGAFQAMCDANRNGKGFEHARFQLHSIRGDAAWISYEDYGESQLIDDKVPLEGQRGFVISGQKNTDQPSYALAVLTFDQIEGIDSSYPVIRQLQGLTHHKDDPARHRQAADLLSSFDWRKVCVDTMLNFAQTNGFPAVAITPGDQNVNVHLGTLRLERAQQLYDQLATRCGFAREANDLYMIRVPHEPAVDDPQGS